MVCLKQLTLATSLFLLNLPAQVFAAQNGHSRSDVAYSRKRDIDSAALHAALEARGIDPRDLEARQPFFQLIGLAAKGIAKAVKTGVSHRNKHKQAKGKPKGKARPKKKGRRAVRRGYRD